MGKKQPPAQGKATEQKNTSRETPAPAPQQEELLELSDADLKQVAGGESGPYVMVSNIMKTKHDT